METRLDVILQTDWEGEATRLGLWAEGHRMHGVYVERFRGYCIIYRRYA